MQSLGLLWLVFDTGLSVTKKYKLLLLGVFPLMGHLCRLTNRCGCFSVHRSVGWSGSENWLMGIQQNGLEFSLGFTVQIQLAKTPLKLEKCWSYWWILAKSFFSRYFSLVDLIGNNKSICFDLQKYGQLLKLKYWSTVKYMWELRESTSVEGNYWINKTFLPGNELNLHC